MTVKTVESHVERGRALIGIRVSQAADIKLPLKVDINLGDVGGPSAGLPFALDVLQELGTNVDHGRRVVATGEIALDGSVGPIGGVKQKTFGARTAGADVFLVPAGDNATEARRYAGNLRIIAVKSFQQALSALRTLPRNSVLQGFCRAGQRPLIAALSFTRPLRQRDLTATILPCRRGQDLFYKGRRAWQLKHLAVIAISVGRVSVPFPGDDPCPTFRAVAAGGRLQPPRQPRLVIRPAAPLVSATAA